MLNQITLVGKVAKDLELREARNGRPFAIETLEVDKENSETGKYETEEIDVSLWGLTAENTAKYAGEGSTITVRGRAVNRVSEFPDKQAIETVGIVGERVSFIQLREPGSVEMDVSESETNWNVNSLLDKILKFFVSELYGCQIPKRRVNSMIIGECKIKCVSRKKLLHTLFS